MKMRTVGSAIAIIGLAAFVGCLGTEDEERTGDAELPAQATDAEIAASCSLKNPKKVAICHIPPGNPANAHTICISQKAVDTHNTHHGDHLGPCVPSDGSGGGDSGTGGSTSSSSSSGTGGSDTTSTSSSSGSGANPPTEQSNCSEEYPPCTSHDDCDIGASCLFGCCVPFTN